MNAEPVRKHRRGGSSLLLATLFTICAFVAALAYLLMLIARIGERISQTITGSVVVLADGMNRLTRLFLTAAYYCRTVLLVPLLIFHLGIAIVGIDFGFRIVPFASSIAAFIGQVLQDLDLWFN